MLFATDDDPACGLRHYVCVVRYAGSAATLLLAGILAYGLTRRRSGLRIAGPLLLGGVAYAPALEGAAELRADLRRIVGWNSIPYLVVGAFLLMPLPKSVDSHRTAE